ncbi:MAG: GNAT family N-acetyltransferase [bacterium]
MRYRIAKMTIRDYEAVITLWRGLPGIGLDDDSDAKAGIARYLKRNPGLSFVARCDRTVVGAVLSGHDGRRGYLHHLAVAVPHRKQGLGQLLVNRCLRALAARRISKCNIFLFRSNAAGRAFWEHAGWNTRGDLHILQKATRRKA